MSEYQYYEFQAIDRPLTVVEQDEVRALSSRVQLTPTQAIFTYSHGDFRGDPLTVLAAHFDAMLYVANWGSKQLAFRFPRALVDVDRLKPYYYACDEISLTTTEQHVVLDINFAEEEGTGWVEGEGLLTALAPLREDLMRGDLRALYLAGLKASQYADDVDDDDEGSDDEENESSGPAELPVLPAPAGLGQLSPRLRAFVDFLDIDHGLIATAAASSAPLAQAEDRIDEWVELLPESERTVWLIRLAKGEPRLDMHLLRRLREVAKQ